MIGLKRIEFCQVEGPAHECRLRSFFSWADVNNHVRFAARQAPHDGTVYRCDVMVEWQDGARRYLRFDMQRTHSKTFTPVSDDFWHDVQFYSGRQRPDHMTEAEYIVFLNQFDDEIIAYAGKLLDGYDLGVRQ